MEVRIAAGGGRDVGDRDALVAAEDGVVLVVLGDHVRDHVDEALPVAQRHRDRPVHQDRFLEHVDEAATSDRVLADRGNRKLQLITAQTLNAILNFLLAWLILSSRIEVWHVYATGFLVAIVQVFEIPARQSMLPESVDRARLTNAIGLQSVAFNISQSLGPALAGLLVALSGPGGSYMAQGLIYAFSTVWTIQLRLRERICRTIPVTSTRFRTTASAAGRGRRM